MIKLSDTLSVDSTPGIASVDFRCTYDTTIDVTSAEFDVEDVSISGTTSGTGKLDTGFELTVGDGSAIILGQAVTVKAEWSVKLSDVSPHFEECKVHHGDKDVTVVKQGCIAGAVGLTDLTPTSDTVSYEMKTFTIDGVTGKNQRMECQIKLCATTSDGSPKNCAKEPACPVDGNDEHFGYV